MNGFMGRILRVDLTEGKLWDEPLHEGYARDYVGSSGLAARYLYDLVDGSTDPLGPDNPLIFMTGPFVGTAVPCSGRYSASALSPLTGIWGEGNSGGFFGPEFKFAGYDGIIITGQSPKPVWLSIINGAAELHDAAELWGKDSYDTQTLVKEKMGEPKAKVACIGVAGEHLVKMAAIVNDHGRVVARTGMGAVMGSKKLKAIGARGSAPVPLADPALFKDAVNQMLAFTKEDMAAQAIQLAGTAGYAAMGMMYGDLPSRYFQQGEWEEVDNISGVTFSTTYFNKRKACYRCPIACGRETNAPEYSLEKVDGPEYESAGALGALTLVADTQAVIYANHLCNVYGMDTISTGVTIALAFELYERGLLTQQDTGGIEARYGSKQALHDLITQTAHREGFGNLLAEGNYRLAEHYGVPELAATVNRLEVPLHDPRAFHAQGVAYVLSPRGACHMEGDMYGVDTAQNPVDELGIPAGDRFDSSEEKGRLTARHQSWRNLYNALTMCQFENPGARLIAQALTGATGWEVTPEGLLEMGKRIATLKRLINLERGLTRQDEHLPDLLMKPLENSGTEGSVPNMDTMLKGAYLEYGWDIETGKPFPETLKRLGIEPATRAGA